jgi:uncharacterized protein YndB with AHSA1/START domain
MNTITVETTVNAPLEKVWDYWNQPEHITKWAFADPSWTAPEAENDLKTGGKFRTRMEAKDGSEGFDFAGVYSHVKDHELIEYDMDDGRHVKVEFATTPEGTKVTETFDPENENPEDLQKSGWQGILENFKKHVESS